MSSTALATVLLLAGATTEGSLHVGGEERTFRVHAPAHLPPGPRPLVLMLHGGGGGGQQLEERSSWMNEVADREGFFVVYPDGTGLVQTWNAGRCCGKGTRKNIDDTAFISALLDHLEATLPVDTTRVYAAGMSNGAMMSHRLGCELSTRFAAIGAVAGTLGLEQCKPTRPVPVLVIHGSADANVPWDGGVGKGPSKTNFRSVPETVDTWAAANGCGADSMVTRTEAEATCTRRTGCRAGAHVELCRLEDTGHSWPGGKAKRRPRTEGDGPQAKWQADEALWAFFAAHPMPPLR